MQIRVDDPTAPYVADLLTLHLRELQGAMAGHAFALDATGLSAASVTFWTAWDGDTLLGFGALKQLDDTHGEVKSMRAAPAARGKGVGRAMLAHIVGEARERGYSRLSLETGTAPLHAPAIALYRSAGFTSCSAFADYQPSPHNQFFRLDLLGSAAQSATQDREATPCG
ncbi:acetyltransferase family protein [Novosphingobium sp. Rr 2-17]|uniref:GNAT family N-acetyltransferase n=1 Tax=Novosphingobium sp. Rr 2-17 TaxID=555793 RepID=UPI000269A26A|nr:GNAT family N-acetyltransferase [Novosphingobium sp. Rr 2-17]EIZ77304.1 acetyltransferase family protein [Novosphingobium sp. Rr 2-17]